MSSFVRHPLVLALLLAAWPAVRLDAAVPDYGQLQVQARTNLLVNDEGYNLPPGSSFNSVTPGINAAGEVTFPVQIVTIPDRPGESGIGIWAGGNGVGGIVQRHDPESGETYISDRAWINASGQIAYITHAGGTSYRARIHDPASGTSNIVNLFPLIPSTLSAIVVNDAGTIGYQAGFSGSGRGFASTGEGSSVLHAADAGVNPASTYVYLYTPAMNNQRVIAGKVSVGDYSHNEIRLFDADGDSTLVVADKATDPASPFRSFQNSLALNDHGAVAVTARLDAENVDAVYRFQDGEAVEIARVGGEGPLVSIEAFAPAINGAGLVAFRATDADGQAIYVGDGTRLVRVFGNGDPIQTDLGAGQFGQHDGSPVFGGAPAINDRGDIVAIAGVHPAGDNQVEWGSAVVVAYAIDAAADEVFADGFEAVE